MFKNASITYSKRLFNEISSWLNKVNNVYTENVRRNGSFELDDITINKFAKINENSQKPFILNANGSPLILARKTFDVKLEDFGIDESKVKNKEVFKKIFKDNKINDTLGIYIYQHNITITFDGIFFQKYHALMIGINTLEKMKETLIHELTHYNEYIHSILLLNEHRFNDLYNKTDDILYLPNSNKVIDPEQKYEYEFWSWYNTFLYQLKKLLKNNHPEHKNLSRIIFNQLFIGNAIDDIKRMKLTGDYKNNILDYILYIVYGKINSDLGKKVIKSIDSMKRETISSKIRKEILNEIKINESKLKKLEQNGSNDTQELKNNISSLQDYLSELKFKVSYTYFLKKLITDLIKENLLPPNTNFKEYKK